MQKRKTKSVVIRPDQGRIILILLLAVMLFSCNQNKTGKDATKPEEISASYILGNPEYQAISYGGYRTNTRDIQPGVEELKEDMKILSAMGIKVLRTYNTKLPHASNVLQAIHEIKQTDPNFEMYVMLGAWINCKNAFTKNPDHTMEDEEENQAEIDRAVAMANKYPEIVKILAVGNEAMVKWAASYFVQPDVILKYVRQLQAKKENGLLPANLWITSSDNFASWGGGDTTYHVKALEELIQAVDYISMHTYPMHDTHYNPDFWGISETEKSLSAEDQADRIMDRAVAYARKQYNSTSSYVKNLEIQKEIHIGETGWASHSNGFYGNPGSRAVEEYKAGLYYKKMRSWTNKDSISCFYFEAFDENWKDSENPGGSENHFGLFTIDGKAKYAIWEFVDEGRFKTLKRGENEIEKTNNGDLSELIEALPDLPILMDSLQKLNL